MTKCEMISHQKTYLKPRLEKEAIEIAKLRYIRLSLKEVASQNSAVGPQALETLPHIDAEYEVDHGMGILNTVSNKHRNKFGIP